MTATAEAQGGTRPLPPIAAKVDRALVDLDAKVDWLTALSHLVVLEQLIDEGWVTPPELMPRYWSNPATDDRLAHCRSIPVSRLCHKEPLQ